MIRLLLVEDDPVIRIVAKAALGRAEFDVSVAANGLEALRCIATAAPDVILLDWMMPELDGPSTCARLKGDPATKDIPVIFLTSRSGQEDRQRCLALGAAGIIAKPFDPQTLGAHARQLLAGAS
jgi:CheY-like chemotaxis protein